MARSKAQNDWIREALTGKDPETYDSMDERQARNLFLSTKALTDRLLMVKVKHQARYNADVKTINIGAHEEQQGGTPEQN